MGPHPTVESFRDRCERLLEPGVGERLDPAAVVTYEVMVMFSARVGGLEPRNPVAELDTLHEVELDELLEGAIDARNPDALALPADVVEDLLRRMAARLGPEMLDHGPAGAPVAEPLRLEALERSATPVLVMPGHVIDDTDSHSLLVCGNAFENHSL